jgi:hypothetical protein
MRAKLAIILDETKNNRCKFSLFRFPLVDAVHEERDEVERKEQDEYYLYHFEAFINSLIQSSL